MSDFEALSQARSKVLIQRTDRLGDTVLALPVVEALKKQYPSIEIHFLCSPISASLLKNHPLIDKVWILDWKSPHFYRHVWSLITSLRKESYCLYVSLWTTFWTSLIGWLSHIPIRFGDREAFMSSLFYTHPVARHWHNFVRHEVEFNLDMLAPLSLNLSEPIIDLHSNLPHSKKERPCLFIFWGSGGSNNPFSEDLLLEFMSYILNKGTMTITLCYGANQVPHKLKIFQHPLLDNRTSMDDLPTLVDLISSSDFYVASDTGPSHIASFLKKPMVLFFGSSHNPPSRWGSFSDYQCIIRQDTEPPLESRSSHQNCLISSFDTLQHHVLFHPPLTDTKRRHYLWLHSFRILYFLDTEDPRYEEIFSKIISLQQQGLFIFPIEKKLSLFSLYHLILKHNITIIQGAFSNIAISIIRRYLDLTKKHLIPLKINDPISKSLDDTLELYVHHWQQAKA